MLLLNTVHILVLIHVCVCACVCSCVCGSAHGSGCVVDGGNATAAICVLA